MTATLGWLPRPRGPGPVEALSVEVAGSRTDWSHARRLLLEYLECASAAIGIDVAHIAPRIWQEVEAPAARYRSPDSLLLVARQSDEPVGIAGLHVSGRSAEVVRMYVRPPHRRRGVAVALLDGLREEAWRRGVRRLYLGTDPVGMAPAVRLYERYGFQLVGTEPIDGFEFVRMELLLAGTP